jgi:hypothetical protein
MIAKKYIFLCLYIYFVDSLNLHIKLYLDANMNTTLSKLVEFGDASQSNTQCERLNTDDLVFHSSEQYLIVCLKICNLIINNQCNIENLVDFDNYLNSFKSLNASSNSNVSTLSPTSSPTTTNVYQIAPDTSFLFYHTSKYNPLLISHLNRTECMKYAHRESHKLILFIFGILLCFSILLVNLVTLVVIVKTKRLHTITNILIANLSMSDFLSGVAFLYPCTLNILTINALETYNSYLYKLACNIRQYYYLCLAGYSPMITSLLNSILTLTLLALEKYFAINHPYIYERVILNKRFICYLCIFFTWCISILVSLLPIMGWNTPNKYSAYRGFDCQHPQSLPCMFERIFTLDYILLFTSICCMCALAMLAIYIRIYLVARRHSKQIAQIHSILNSNKKIKSISTSRRIQEAQREHENDENHLDDNKKDARIKPKKTSFHIDSIAYMNESKESKSKTKYMKPRPSRNQAIDDEQFCERPFSQEKSTSSYSTPNQLKSTRIIHKSNSIVQQFKTRMNDNKAANEAKRDELADIDNLEENMEEDMRENRSSQQINTINSSSKILNKNMKAMKTLLILLVGFYLCWLPLIIYFLTYASKKYDNLTIYILMFVACCNAVIDPIVYAFRNPEFYKSLVRFFSFK